MSAFVVRRLLAFIPTIAAVTLVIFVVLNLLPGDAAFVRAAGFKRGVANTEGIDQLREQWGLNDPAYLRYFRFLGGLLRGDLGTSYRTDQVLSEVIKERLPVTLKLAGISILLAVVGGLTFGFLAAIHRGSIIDLVCMVTAIVGVSVPEFWVGLMLMLVVAVKWGLLPTSGYSSGNILYLILPSLALGFRYIGLIARVTRSSMLDVASQDHVRTAHSKGLSLFSVRWKHVFRNALVPILTIVGLESGWLFANTVVVEEVFGLPGIGRLLVVSILGRDIPSMQAAILIMVFTFLILNLAIDLAYGFLDPRIRYS
jgi:peptide/nickel transport system permease protein